MGSQTVPIAATNELTIEAYGVALRVAVDDPTLMEAVIATLPPGWNPCDQTGQLTRFSLASLDGIAYQVARDDAPVGPPVEREVAVGRLDSCVRMEVARRAVGRAFIHAGCVALGARALVLPGISYSGKTTLVHALIGQGATYFSDEYAVLDDEGLVHPYAKPLSIRPADARSTALPARSTETPPSELGAAVGDRAIEVRLIAALTYVPGARWEPTPLSPSQGAMELLFHSVNVHDEPAQALGAVCRAAIGAGVLEGQRGEADQVARIL
ncbi:MAG TPA: hypothetical protein VGK33_18125, partial [Chloroflexota bacterium]